ncbi:hypothetical protein EDB85DRAFT_1891790 [Lactarius pseudohatsudake]|nr:hypothetical protein EDB85DRAFT_1891790 [Lactarius pseudohatsudake]
MPHVHGDDANDSLGHPANRIHLVVHPDDDDNNNNTHNTPPTQTLAVQFAAINRPRCPANAGCQWFHPPNTMATVAAVATADHDTDRNSMPVARRQQQQQKRSSNDNTTATAIAVVMRRRSLFYMVTVVITLGIGQWWCGTTVFLHRGVESYTAGLTRSYGCGAAAGAVSRVAGMVLGNDTHGATRVIP